ncbi:MAG: hypothetical protein JWQ02_2049 [Capsulimonas sp.]|nr:hypothetical protein [Capsulimonas sp.]
MDDSYDEESTSSNEPRQGIVSLRYLIASATLAYTFAILVRLGLMPEGSAVFAFFGIWLIGQLLLIVKGITFGIRGFRSWQGKCGLYGSILMVLIVICMVWFIVSIAVGA